MMFFRSKNAKILTLIASILVVVVCIYAHLVNRKDTDNKKEIETPSQVQNLIDKDYENEYPASVREVVRTYCKVIENLYNEELSEDDFIDLADVERELLDDELLSKNPYGDFMERLKDEIEEYRKKGVHIGEWTVADNETVSYWYHEKDKYASIYVSIQLMGKSASLINERFILRYDEGVARWKILGWDEASDDDVTSDNSDKSKNPN